MSERAEALASQFEQANNNLISAVQSMSDTQWKAICSGEQWPVGVTAHHVAGGYPVIAGMVQMLAAGGAAPFTEEQLHQGNAQHAREFASCTKEETLGMLRQGGKAAADVVRTLSDEQLGKAGTVFGNPMTAQQGIEMILIGHVQDHAGSIKQATG